MPDGQNTNTLDGLVGQGTATAGQGLFFSLYSDGKAGFSYYAGGLYTQPVYKDTNWHHWAATRDQVTGARCASTGMACCWRAIPIRHLTPAPALSGLAACLLTRPGLSTAGWTTSAFGTRRAARRRSRRICNIR